MSGLYENPCVKSHALYVMASFFSFCFHKNIHLYPTGFTYLDVWTIGPKTSCLESEFNSA